MQADPGASLAKEWVPYSAWLGLLLLKLLGRDAEARATFWAKLKGITTPQEMRLVDNVLNTINEQVRQAEAGTKTLIEVAGEAAKGAAR